MLAGAAAGVELEGEECPAEPAEEDDASVGDAAEEPFSPPCDADAAGVELGVGTAAGTLTAEVEVLAPVLPSVPVEPVELPDESLITSAATVEWVSRSLCPASCEFSRPPPVT